MNEKTISYIKNISKILYKNKIKFKIKFYFDHNNYTTTLIKRRKRNKRDEVYQQD